MSATVEELVYEESRRGLELQREGLDALRTRAGTLLAAAALVTTFFGGQAFEGSRHVGCWGVLAIAAFVGLAVCSVAVLLPWKFDLFLDPEDLVNEYVDAEPKPDLATVHRDFALHHSTSRSNNEKTVTMLQWGFRSAAILLGLEVFAWLMEL